MTPDAVVEKYHVTPEQYPDLAALRGETADNIPGVPGVGDGFAAKWINLYGGLDQIIEHADEIGGKKGEALRANIDQVKLNRSVNALVRDLDLGVSIEDLTFGQVDANQLNQLFTRLEFGIRTKNRVLRTFNAGKPTNDPVQQDESGKLEMPQYETVDSPEALEAWVRDNLPMPNGHLHDEREIAPKTTPSGFAIDHTKQCAQSVAHSWVLQVEGESKPGNAAYASLMIAAHDKAIRTNRVDRDMASQLQTVLDEHHQSMVVHGYKEQSHLLESVGVALPKPLFDTKLAGYLVHPDFHADTLERAAAHFLDLHIEEQSEGATQGTLDFDEPDDSAQRNDNQLPRHTAIVGLLARKLADSLDQREQFSLLESVEIPVSRVLYGMEHAGAQVDMNRLMSMREQLAADANYAQETAWQYAGERVNLQSPKQLQKILFEDMA